MAERIVYLGGLNNNKRQELLDKSIEYLKDNKGHKFYYLFPNGELLKKYRKYFIKESSGTETLNVFTFDDIVSEVLRYSDIKTIENPIKNIIISNILKDLNKENKLIYYRELIDIEGFIHSINDIIGEIKRSLLSPEEYIKSSPNNLKFREIGYIYEEYEDFLNENNLSDREGDYLKAIELIKKTNYLKNLDFIMIDEFYDFRPIEMAILEEIVKRDTDIYINIPYDIESGNLILDKTIKNLEELGFIIENIKKDKKNKFEVIGDNILGDKNNVIDGEDDIVFIKSPSSYFEIRRIFEEIKKFNLEGYKLSDMGIVLASSTYEEDIYKVSKEEGIPVNLNEKVLLRDTRMVREIFTIFENRISLGGKTDLINRVKASYFNLYDSFIRDEIEGILRKEDYGHLVDISLFLTGNSELISTREDLKLLFNLVKDINEEIKEIPIKAKIIDYIEIIQKFILKFKIEEGIIDTYKISKNEELLLRDLRTLKVLNKTLDSLNETIYSHEILSIEDFLFIFNEYSLEEEVLVKAGNEKGIHVLQPVNARGLDKKILFFAGLNQGEYPDIGESGYFINDYNYKYLKELGLDTKSYLERMDNEILKFSSVVSQVKDKIYFSYNTGLEGNGIESIFYSGVIDLINKSEEDIFEIEEISLDYRVKKSLENITNRNDMYSYFIRDIVDKKAINKSMLEIDKNKEVFDLIRRNEGEYYRANNIFNEYKGVLSDKNLINKINNSSSNKYSISGLENYINCPYSYFLSRVLKIDETIKDFEDYSHLDIGSIYHEALRVYYNNYKDDIYNYVCGGVVFSVLDTKDYIYNLLEDIGKDYDLDSKIKKDYLLIQSMSNYLYEFIKKDIDRLREDSIIPVSLEEDFGYKEDFNINYKGDSIKMYGRIDRVDKYLDKNDYIVIDYKTGSQGANGNDILRGDSLQLPVYILSQEEKGNRCIAGGYSIIKKAETKLALGIKGESGIHNSNSGSFDIDDWNDLLIKTKAYIIELKNNIELGNFKIKPKNCSEYCIYKDVCRYKKILEVE